MRLSERIRVPYYEMILDAEFIPQELADEVAKLESENEALRVIIRGKMWYTDREIDALLTEFTGGTTPTCFSEQEKDDEIQR